jgi:O-antigen/teichoic acid export membrane protein
MGTSLDRIITVTFLGAEPTGLYFMGVTLSSVLLMLPEALSRVFNPKLNQTMGECSDPGVVATVVWGPTRSLAWILPLAFGCLVFFIDPLYRTGFPKYLPAVVSSQILIMGAVPLSFIPLGTDFYVAIHRQRQLALLVPLSLLMNVVLNLVGIKFWGIEWVATVSLLTSCVVAGYLWWKVSSYLPGQSQVTSEKESSLLIERPLLSLTYGFMSSLLLTWILERGVLVSWSGWLGGIGKALVYGITYLLLILIYSPTRRCLLKDSRYLYQLSRSRWAQAETHTSGES